MLLYPDFSIRISAGQSSLTAHRSFSQLTTSFIGSQCQGIRPALFLALPFAFLSSLKLLYNCSFSRLFDFKKSKSCRFTWLYFFRYSIFKFLFCPFWEQKLTDNLFYLLIYALKMHFLIGMVGTSGLEPPTSRLSGVRSNHLSYAPFAFWKKLGKNF